MKHFSQKEFNQIYSKVPRLAIEIVIKQSKKILLTKRSNSSSYKGYWHIPGGTLYQHEKIDKALKRIALDELGVEVEIIKFLNVEEFTTEEKTRHTVCLVYQCKIVKGDISLNSDATAWGWFDIPPKKTIAQHKKYFKI